MTRDKQTLHDLYRNLLSGPTPVSEHTQRRIYEFAKRTKSADLAALLAQRSELAAELDHELSGWAVAKVQSAWFSKPGRKQSEVAERLGREKRVTVLEAGAAIPELSPEIYRSFATKDSPRIALQLLKNPSAPADVKTTAAGIIGRNYEKMSYSKKYELRDQINSSGPDAVAAFIENMQSLSDIRSAIMNFDGCGSAGIKRVYELIARELAEVPSLEAAWKKEKQTRSWYRAPHVEAISNISDVLRVLTNWPVTDTPERVAVRKTLSSLHTRATHGGAKDFVEELTEAVRLIGGSNPDLDDRVNRARSAGSLKALRSLLKAWTASSEELDEIIAGHLLCNPYTTVEFVTDVLDATRWAHRSSLVGIVAADPKVSLEILGAVMIGLHSYGDDDIEQVAARHDKSEVWAAIVKAELRQNESVPSYLLESKYASPEVVPQLPITVMAQRALPDWVQGAVVAYLEKHLSADKAWDSFEVLAPRHLGTLEQLVKAANTATRRR